MPFLLKKSFTLFFLIIVILIAFGLGNWYGKSQVVCEFCQPQQVNFSLCWEAWDKIEKEYVDKGNLDVQEMIYGAISGMINSLGDPYTIFLNPGETERFISDVQGAFEGVGMEIGIKKEQLQVIAPLEGTPAQKAGLRAGDKILKINGTSTLDITIDEAVNLIRGPKGTEVALTIYREDWEETKEIKIIRGIIEIPSLKWEMIEDDIALIKLYNFTEKAGSSFNAAAVEILNSGAEKIILDLRNDPGGYLQVSQHIASWFLERGEVVVIEDFGGDKEQVIYKAEGNAKLLPYPLVVLINEGSASASEILAGCLRDNRNIKLIGQTSFGKGSVQELSQLSEGSSLKITIAKWLTPKGELIADKGLKPDFEVEITDLDYEEEKDPQLDKAIEILNSL